MTVIEHWPYYEDALGKDGTHFYRLLCTCGWKRRTKNWHLVEKKLSDHAQPGQLSWS